MAGVKLSAFYLRTAAQSNNTYTIPILSNDSPKVNYKIEFSALKDFILDSSSQTANRLAYFDSNGDLKTDRNINIDSSGNVGVGKTPVYQLELSTDSAGKPTTSTWTITSDERIKKNIASADLDRCYEIVKTLPLKHYGWKYYDKTIANDQNMLGWIAQDVQDVFPKAVNTKDFIINPEEKDEQGNVLKEAEIIKDCLDLNADQINKALYGAVQKLMIDVENLKTEIEILKNK